MKLKEIAAKLGARLDPPEADADIHGVAAIESAAPGEITFVANPKYTAAAQTTRASAIIVDEKFPAQATPLLRIQNPQYGYLRAVALFHQPPKYEAGIHPSAFIHPSARIGKNASIGPFVMVEAGAEIGDDCTLVSHVAVYRDVKIGRNFFAHSHVSIRENCSIGDHVILHNGVVIGSDGFGFAKDNDGRWQKIHQAGRVVIEDEVEIQANSCIDRASLGETRIGRGTKIDNLVQIGHNCAVGENNMICAQVGLAGSTRLGNNVILAGQVGIAGPCSIGDGAILTAQSGVSHDVEAGQMLSGSPAFDNRQWLRSVAAFSRLGDIAKAVRAVTRQGKEG